MKLHWGLSEMEVGKPERMNNLMVYLSISKSRNRRTLNNGIYVSQQTGIVPPVYTDFQSFGRLGVSSFELNWDYSALNGQPIEPNYNLGSSAKTFEKAARLLSNYSFDEVRLLSCLLWNDGKSLSSEERRAADRIKRRVTKELPLF